MNKNDKKANRSKKGLVNPNRITVFQVYKETDLLSFLEYKMPNLKTKTIRHLIANSQVSVGGVPTTLFSFKVYPEDEVLVSRDRITKKRRKDLPIIYEDDEIIVMNKPSGLLSIASDREKGRTAYRLISDYVDAKKPGSRIFVVHRLDEDTSGVLIFAKTHEIKEAFQNNWQSIVEKRGYYAIVEGDDIPEEGHLEDYLGENDLHLVYVTKDRRKGKLSVTDYRKIASKNGISLLDVDIKTGRKNQIRVQLGHIGHHVIGDDKYGEPINPINRLGLHAYELKLTHPISGKTLDFKVPMPDEFKQLFFAKGNKITAKPQLNTKKKGGKHNVANKISTRKA